MPCFICEACGTQHADSPRPPLHCAVCEDERQPSPRGEQAWTTLTALRAGYRAEVRECEPGLTGIGMTPVFAIGQRALLLEAPEGNVLWDCIPLVDDELGAAIEGRGGLATIAISHPHYYTTMVEWARAFDARVLLHADDREWILRQDPAIDLWRGESRELSPGLTLARLGGHFPGGTVLHWAAGAAGKGALLTGDIVQIVPDPGWVSFMYSYPNLIPLSAPAVRRLVGALEPYRFDRLYGAWWDRVVATRGKEAITSSADRYIRSIAPT